MSPFAQGKGTSHQRTHQRILMAMAVMLARVLISQVNREKHQSLFAASAPLEQQHCSRFSSTPPDQQQQFVAPAEFWSKATHQGRTLVIYQTPTMPRARGKPRRGAAWYTTESRHQRKKKFEKAITMAAIRRSTTPRMPPMAYVEEVIPKGGLESVHEHTLFTVPNNWNPPSEFGSDSKPPPVSIPPGPSATSLEEPYPTCYVEEEIPPEPPGEAALQAHKQQEHTHHEAAEPIPPLSMDSHRQEQSLFADSGYLTLIFELRSLLDDQIFHLT
jgi:hypothetical protein